MQIDRTGDTTFYSGSLYASMFYGLLEVILDVNLLSAHADFEVSNFDELCTAYGNFFS
jgi:hypothetical protein